MSSGGIHSERFKHRIALVQGEGFRCVAAEFAADRWRQVPGGTELPRVLEVVAVLRECQGNFKAADSTCLLTGAPCDFKANAIIRL